MAGIGFELKKMFSKKGLFAIVKAYGYAGIVCVGPMILGICLLIGIRILSGIGGASDHDQELLNSMITYTLLFSLILTNVTSLVTTRYIADQLYMEENQKIMPSFWGSISIMLIPGCICYGIFLHLAGIPLMYQVLCYLLFGELIFVWTQINYLTALKDYKGILVTFAVALVAAWVVGALLLYTGMDIIASMLLSICVGYGVMTVWYYKLLAEFFPKGESSSMYFIRWFEKYPELAALGAFLAFGLFGHIVIMWTSPIGVQIQGLYYGAPQYDVSALLAFVSILITTISFVTSVEVNFYKTYRNYFSLFNNGGSLVDLRQAEREMKETLKQELTHTYTKQFFATIVFIIAGTLLLPKLPLGLTEEMLGIYRILCVGYAFYAIGNCNMLLQLYFADNKGALISAAVFMIVSCTGTILLKEQNNVYYGVGFLIGGVCFALVSLFLLWRYTRVIMYHVLCKQPVVARETAGVLTRLSDSVEEKYHIRFHENHDREEEDDSEEE